MLVAADKILPKDVEFLHSGVHLLIVDLFPPSKRDPQPGVHKLIWDRICDEQFELPTDKPLTLAAYSSGTTITAHIEPVAVADEFPDLPIDLTTDRYVNCPFEATYRASWAKFPAALEAPLESPHI